MSYWRGEVTTDSGSGTVPGLMLMSNTWRIQVSDVVPADPTVCKASKALNLC